MIRFQASPSQPPSPPLLRGAQEFAKKERDWGGSGNFPARNSGDKNPPLIFWWKGGESGVLRCKLPGLNKALHHDR